MILLIETSSAQLSIALCDIHGTILTEEFAEKENAHAEKLATLVEKVLLFGNNKIEAIGVSNGPGSYTGLRIGTSFAKGMCYALGIPLLALNAFKGMANFAKQALPSEYFFSILDARRDEVYIQGFNSYGESILPLQAMILSDDKLLDFATKNVCICGNATDKWEILMPQFIHSQYQFMQPKASFLAVEAAEKFQLNQLEDLAYYEPFYLKNFIPGTPKKAKS